MNSDLIDNINKKDAYLEKHVFYGLKDLNDGFDYRNNQYCICYLRFKVQL